MSRTDSRTDLVRWGDRCEVVRSGQVHNADSGSAHSRSPNGIASGPVCRRTPMTKRSPSLPFEVLEPAQMSAGHRARGLHLDPYNATVGVLQDQVDLCAVVAAVVPQTHVLIRPGHLTS